MNFRRYLPRVALLLSVAAAAQNPNGYKLMGPAVLTASSQTSQPIPMGSSWSAGTIQLTGSSLTTATYGVLASTDNGKSYHAWPICTVAASPSCANTQLATADGFYSISLTGVTHIEYVTSGTFTATSISLLLTASPNAQASKSSSGTSGVAAINGATGPFTFTGDGANCTGTNCDFPGGTGSPGGSTTQVQINAAGTFGADPTFSFNSSTKNVSANVNSEISGASFSSSPMRAGAFTGASIDSSTPTVVTCTGCFPSTFVGSYVYRTGDQTNGETHGSLTRIDANTATMQHAWTGPSVGGEPFYYGPDNCTAGNAWFTQLSGGSGVLPTGYFLTSCQFVQGNSNYFGMRGMGIFSTYIVYTGGALANTTGVVDTGTLSGGGISDIENIGVLADSEAARSIYTHGSINSTIRNVYAWESTEEAFASNNMVGQSIHNLVGRPTSTTILNSSGCRYWGGSANGPGGTYDGTCEHGTSYGINVDFGQVSFYNEQFSSSQKGMNISMNGTVFSHDTLYENIGTPGDFDNAGTFVSENDGVFGPVDNTGDFVATGSSMNNSLINRPDGTMKLMNYRYTEDLEDDQSSTHPIVKYYPYNITEGDLDSHGQLLQFPGANPDGNGIVGATVYLDNRMDKSDIKAFSYPLFAGALWELQLWAINVGGDSSVPLTMTLTSANPSFNVPAIGSTITFSLDAVHNRLVMNEPTHSGIHFTAWGSLHPHVVPSTFTDDFVAAQTSITVAGQNVCQQNGTNCPAAGATTFDLIGSGTNLGHGLVLGTGAVMTTAGSGINNANELNGVLLSGLSNSIYKFAAGIPSASALSDDGTTVTISEPTTFSGTTHGITIPAGASVAGSAGNVVYTSDATSGFAEINENNTGNSRACTSTNGICTVTIASGTSSLGTSAIASATCATVVTTTATGAASTDAISWNTNGSIKAITGYIPSTSGGLTINGYPTTNSVNWDVCNWTSASITPGAVTLNWRVVR